MIHDELLDLGYPTGPVPLAFAPTVLPVSLPELARGILWETRIDPLRCTVEQFEELKEALDELPIASEVREMLPDLRLVHLLFAMADHEALAAVDATSEDSIDYHQAKEGCSRELVEEAAARWAAAFQEYASRYYTRADELLGLG